MPLLCISPAFATEAHYLACCVQLACLPETSFAQLLSLAARDGIEAPFSPVKMQLMASCGVHFVQLRPNPALPHATATPHGRARPIIRALE